MHGRSVAGFKIKHPRAKILRPKEVAVANLLLSCLADFLVEIDEIHGPLSCALPAGTYRAVGRIVKLIGMSREARGGRKTKLTLKTESGKRRNPENKTETMKAETR